MKYGFIAKHRGVWPIEVSCGALGISKSGFYAWLGRSPSARQQMDERLKPVIQGSFVASDRTYGYRRVWRDVLAAGFECGRRKIERLMRQQALRARPRRRGKPVDRGDGIRSIASNIRLRQI